MCISVIMCVCVCLLTQLEKFLLFEKNLMLLSTFASHLPHNLCPTTEWSSVTDWPLSDNETDSADHDKVCKVVNDPFNLH